MKYLFFTFLIVSNSFCSLLAQNNYESLNSESVLLHTDRDIYIAGDNLFYTMYLRGTPGRMSRYAYIVLRDRQNTSIVQVRVEIRNQMAFGNIYLSDTLHSDVYQLVCYTNRMRNEGEESYFTKEIVIANRFDKKLEQFDSIPFSNSLATSPGQSSGNEDRNGNLIIHLDKQEFNTREKVMFSVETNNIPGDSITRLSVSISEIVPGMHYNQSFSDYSGDIIKTAHRRESAQNQYRYQPEVNGSIMEGRVLRVQQTDNQPVIDNQAIKNDTNIYTILVSTPDSIANMQYTTTDPSGSFRFILNPYYEGKELIIRLKEKASAVIELDDKFKLNRPFIPSKKFNVPGIKSYLIRCMNIEEVQRFYSLKAEADTGIVLQQATAVPRVYYQPYSRVFPADFLQLPDFVEISRELLPAFKVRKDNDNYISSFIDTRNEGFLNIEPIIFLDGVPVNDVNQIINLGTNQIKRIDMLPIIRYYGEMRLSGILAVFSKNLEINNIQFTTPAVSYQVIPNQSFTKPKHYIPADINKHIPDVRQVLFWDPEIRLRNKENKQIEFYTADLQGNYLISVKGITSNGLPLNASAIFMVKSKSN